MPGGSTGINVAGVDPAAPSRLGPGKTIVTILCDPETAINRSCFNPSVHAHENLPVPEWLEKQTVSVPFGQL